jgi:membrane protease YdiL (CAAX protease family)
MSAIPPTPDLEYASPAGRGDPRLPRVWPAYCDFVILLGTVLVAQVALCIVLAIYLTATGVPVGSLADRMMALVQRPPVFAAGLAVTICIELCAAIVPALCSPTAWHERLALRKVRISWVVLMLAAIGSTAYGISFDAFSNLLALRSSSLEQLSETLSGAEGLPAIAIVFCICVAGPIAEELVFRGYIQTRLVARHGAMLGIFLTAVFFAILHMNPLHSAFAFGFGICMGVMALRAGSIVPTIVAHMFNNSFATLANWALPAPETWWGDLLVGVLAGGVAVLLLVPLLVVRAKRPRASPQSAPCVPPATPDRERPPLSPPYQSRETPRQ